MSDRPLPRCPICSLCEGVPGGVGSPGRVRGTPAGHPPRPLPGGEGRGLYGPPRQVPPPDRRPPQQLRGFPRSAPPLAVPPPSPSRIAGFRIHSILRSHSPFVLLKRDQSLPTPLFTSAHGKSQSSSPSNVPPSFSLPWVSLPYFCATFPYIFFSLRISVSGLRCPPTRTVGEGGPRLGEALKEVVWLSGRGGWGLADGPLSATPSHLRPRGDRPGGGGVRPRRRPGQRHPPHPRDPRRWSAPTPNWMSRCCFPSSLTTNTGGCGCFGG